MAPASRCVPLLLLALLMMSPQAHARVQLLRGQERATLANMQQRRQQQQQQQQQQQKRQQQQQQHPRRLQQYTGGAVAAAATDPCAAQPCANGGLCVPNGFAYVCRCPDGWGGTYCTQPTASLGAPMGASLAPGSGYQLSGPVPTPANPAVEEVDRAMATGQAPDDIARFQGRAWLRGKILGQRVAADGAARGSVGHNELGGITGVAEASGQFESDGRFGYYAGAGHARAAAASAVSAYDDGGGGARMTVVQGAAAARASGALYGQLPLSGTEVEAAGSASAQAQGTVVVRRPSNAIF